MWRDSAAAGGVGRLESQLARHLDEFIGERRFPPRRARRLGRHDDIVAAPHPVFPPKMQQRCTPRVTGYGEPVTIASAETIGKDQMAGSARPDHQLVTRYVQNRDSVDWAIFGGRNNYGTTLPPLGAAHCQRGSQLR